MAFDLNRLTPEEREQLERLLNKVDPPEEREFGEPPKANPLTITIKRHKSATDMASKRLRVVMAVGRANLEAGIQTPKRDPIKAGASDEAQRKYDAKMQDPAVRRRRQEVLKRRDSTRDWLPVMEAVGLDRYPAGVEATNFKYEQFAAAYEKELARILPEIDAMPDVTLDQRIARSAAMIRRLAELKGKLR